MIEVLIIGGGIAGLESAVTLHNLGIESLILEKEKNIGGHVAQWDTLFPTKRKAQEVIEFYTNEISKKSITVYVNTHVTSISKQDDGTFEVHTSRSVSFKAKTIILASGYSLFNAERKEEYGYKIYSNVVTSPDLELMYKNHKDSFLAPNGNEIKRVAFIHCVGSRDEKSGNHYCSKVCCVTGVKQAIKMKQLNPQAQVFCFYMDLRMYGPGFEEMYREAQEKWGVQFIRGRLSEVAETIDGGLQLKAEDTLAARPFKIEVDMLVLLVGMESPKTTQEIAHSCKLNCSDSRFVSAGDYHISPNKTNISGLFTAGTAIAPLSVFDTISNAKSAALVVNQYLKN